MTVIILQKIPSAYTTRSACSTHLNTTSLAIIWFETGTPSYLVELLKQSHYDLERMANEVTSSDVLNSIYKDLNPIPLIYQSGYLTIKGYDE